MMFQSYALWPHMTVAENVAFGLEERHGRQGRGRAAASGEALESVRMGSLAERRPSQLSGGQQQRVALARALVDPAELPSARRTAFEPGRRAASRDARRDPPGLQGEGNLTAIYVTHDQKEALSIADRMAVLEAGEALQVGTPAEIYRRPSRRSVARFIGETNFIDGRVLSSGGGRAAVETPAGRFEGILGSPGRAPAAGSAATVSVRPECWRLCREVPAGENAVRGRIGRALYLGELAQYEFECAGAALKILELNPRFAEPPGGGELYAVAGSADVVVLTE